jgi:hypothetical protein
VKAGGEPTRPATFLHAGILLFFTIFLISSLLRDLIGPTSYNTYIVFTQDLKVEGKSFTGVSSFTYLGNMTYNGNRIDNCVKERIQVGNRAYFANLSTEQLSYNYRKH